MICPIGLLPVHGTHLQLGSFFVTLRLAPCVNNAAYADHSEQALKDETTNVHDTRLTTFVYNMCRSDSTVEESIRFADFYMGCDFGER